MNTDRSTQSAVDAAAQQPSATGRARVLRLGGRSTVVLLLASAVGLLAFAWPMLIPADLVARSSVSESQGHTTDAPWLFALLLPLLAAVVLAQLSEGGIDAKVVALLGMLTAIGAGLRALSPGAAGLEPGFALLVLAGYAFGPGFGFVLGALSMFAGALLTGGVGPWLPFQMFAGAWVGAGAGLVPSLGGAVTARRASWPSLCLLAAYGVLAGLAYGFVINLWFWPFTTVDTALAFVPGDSPVANAGRYVLFWAATSAGWDLPRGVLTAVLVLAFGRPLLQAFARAGRRARFEHHRSA